MNDERRETSHVEGRARIAGVILVAVAAFFLWSEHRAHLLGALAYLLLLAAAWKILYRAQRQQRLASDGPYGRVRHPQYLAFILIMFGFLLQWPTLITAAMFPLLVVVYARLARQEEGDAQAQFGSAYEHYRARTPAFIPRLWGLSAEERS